MPINNKNLTANIKMFPNGKNKYLVENKLNDQINMFDLILCRHLPAEEDLELYDIVVYIKIDNKKR